MTITAERLRVEVEADTRDATRALDNVSDRGSRIPAWAGLAKAAIVGLGSSAALALGGQMLNAASDLNETLAKTGEVFQGSTGDVTGFANDMAAEYGVAKNVVLDAASSFGLLANAAGLSSDASADMSTNLAALAADASSFYNVPLDEALQKIRSGLVGEAEPMRAFGVLLNEAAVQAKALEMGIWDGTGAMTEAMKVQARAALITEGMATAQGDLARTQESVSNQTREFRGRLMNLAADIGGVFLPAAGGVLSWANDLLATFANSSALTTFQDWMAGLASTAQAAGGGFAGLQAVAQEVMSGFVDWLSGDGMDTVLGALLSGRERFVETILTLVPALVEGLAAAIPGILDWVTGSLIPMLLDTVMMVVATLVEVVPTLVSALADAIPMLLNAGVSLFGSLIDAVVRVLPGLLQSLVAMLPGLLQTILGMVPQILQAAITLFTSLVQAIVQVAPQLINTLMTMLPGLIQTLLDMLPILLESAVTLFMSLVQGLLDALPVLLDTLLGTVLPEVITTLLTMLPDLILAAVDLFQGLVLGLIEMLPSLLDTLINVVLPNLLDTLVGMVPELIDAAITLFTGLIDGLVEFTPQLIGMVIALIPQIVSALISGIGQLIAAGVELLGALWQGLQDKWPEAWEWVKGLPGKMLDGLGDVGSILLDAGRRIMEGLWNGLKDKWGDVQDWFGGIGDWISEHKGPRDYDLRLLVPNGGWIMEGFQVGLERGMEDTRRSVAAFGRDLALAIPEAASLTVTPRMAGTAAAQALAQVPGYSGPTHITVVDADGALIGTMRTQAGRVLTGDVTPLDEGRVSWA